MIPRAILRSDTRSNGPRFQGLVSEAQAPGLAGFAAPGEARKRAPTRRRGCPLRRGCAARMRLQDPPGAGRVFGELVRRPDRAPHQLAAAVGAAALEDRVGAAPAEGALVGADHRLRRLRRQITVAAL